MNFLSVIFSGTGVIFFLFGMLINYTNGIPEIIVRFSKYGRANISLKPGEQSKTPEFLKKLEVPKSWFGHFYMYAVFFQFRIIYTIIRKYYSEDYLERSWLSDVLAVVGGSDRNTVVDAQTTLLASGLFLFHLTRRLLETWYISIYSGSKMNVVHYALGFIHYTLAPLALVSQSYGFASDLTGNDIVNTTSPTGYIQIAGVCIFIYGNYQQFLAHKGYSDLRKGKKSEAAKKAYEIPRGGLFESVSCPNYWTEILIYASFAYITGFQNWAWNCCTVWVISNQIVSGVMNHQWYLKKFGESYPKSRKAIIPYIW